MPILRIVTLVDLSTLASVAAAETAIAAAEPAGAHTEDTEQVYVTLRGETGTRSVLALKSSVPGASDWTGVTSSRVRILPLESFADEGALTAAITAIIAFEFAAVPARQLRSQHRWALVIAGAQVDCLVFTFTDGTPGGPVGPPGPAGPVGPHFLATHKDARDALITDVTAETSVGRSAVAQNLTLGFFVPDLGLVGDPANNASINVYARTGAGPRRLILQLVTTASWVAFVPQALPVIGAVAMAAGDAVTWEILKNGLGVSVPSGELVLQGT